MLVLNTSKRPKQTPAEFYEFRAVNTNTKQDSNCVWSLDIKTNKVLGKIKIVLFKRATEVLIV